MTMKQTRGVLSHSLVRSLIHSHRSLIHLLNIARFTRALRCAHSFARSLAPELIGKRLHLNAQISYHFNPQCNDDANDDDDDASDDDGHDNYDDADNDDDADDDDDDDADDDNYENEDEKE